MLDGLFSSPIQKKEIWEPVVGYEGLYEVSNLGRVRSLDRVVSQKNRHGTVSSVRYHGRVMRPHTSRDRWGYPQVKIPLSDASTGRGPRTRHVCHLVAEAFIGPRPEGREVAHWDGNSENNAASNIRYATKLENGADKARHGTAPGGEDHWGARLTASAVLDLRRRYEAGERQKSLAVEFGISKGHASRICRGRAWRRAA